MNSRVAVSLFLVCCLFTSCAANNQDDEDASNSVSRSSSSETGDRESTSDEEEFSSEATDEDENSLRVEDGAHSATVEYYNHSTGTRSTYSLDVDVEDNEIESISFPNGGHLDRHHFRSGGDLDEGKSTTIQSDEEDAEYTVTIDD
jgi:hypothetical protein